MKRNILFVYFFRCCMSERDRQYIIHVLFSYFSEYVVSINDGINCTRQLWNITPQDFLFLGALWTNYLQKQPHRVTNRHALSLNLYSQISALSWNDYINYFLGITYFIWHTHFDVHIWTPLMINKMKRFSTTNYSTEFDILRTICHAHLFC